MTYRGIVQGGVVVLEDAGGLPDGTPVEVRPRRRARSKPVTKPAPRPPVGAVKKLYGAGLWKDRTDLGVSGAEASLMLRRRIERRERDG